MSAANPYGIFASSIDHKFDFSTRTIRNLIRTDDHAERIVKVAALTCTIRDGYSVEDNEAYIRELADGFQVKVARRVALVVCALSTVESAYTVYHRQECTGEGFESVSPISDTRPAGELAYAILMAA